MEEVLRKKEEKRVRVTAGRWMCARVGGCINTVKKKDNSYEQDVVHVLWPLTDYSHSLYCREKRGVSWPTTIWQTPSPFPNPVPLYRRQRASECVNGSMGKAKGERERKNDTLQEDNHWAIKWRLRICLTMLQTQACKNTRAQETTHKHCWITPLPNDIGSINVLYIS